MPPSSALISSWESMLFIAYVRPVSMQPVDRVEPLLVKDHEIGQVNVLNRIRARIAR